MDIKIGEANTAYSVVPMVSAVAFIESYRKRKELKEAGYKNVYLWVLKENYHARRFYEKNGFHCCQDKGFFEIMGSKHIDIRYVYSF